MPLWSRSAKVFVSQTGDSTYLIGSPMIGKRRLAPLSWLVMLTSLPFLRVRRAGTSIPPQAPHLPLRHNRGRMTSAGSRSPATTAPIRQPPKPGSLIL